MNTQTFAHAQAFTAITDDELMAVNGGLLPLIPLAPLAIGTAVTELSTMNTQTGGLLFG